MRKRDYIILCGLLLLGILLSVFIFRPSDGIPGTLEVRQDNKIILTLPLSENTVKTIPWKDGGRNTFSVQGGAVTMTEADCGDHTCVKTGTISKAGESIVCLPHRLVLQIKAGSADSKQAPDAIVH